MYATHFEYKRNITFITNFWKEKELLIVTLEVCITLITIRINFHLLVSVLYTEKNIIENFEKSSSINVQETDKILSIAPILRQA